MNHESEIHVSLATWFCSVRDKTILECDPYNQDDQEDQIPPLFVKSFLFCLLSFITNNWISSACFFIYLFISLTGYHAHREAHIHCTVSPRSIWWANRHWGNFRRHPGVWAGGYLVTLWVGMSLPLPTTLIILSDCAGSPYLKITA